MVLINSSIELDCSFLYSTIGLGVGKGKFTIIREDKMSPGQSTPSQDS